MDLSHRLSLRVRGEGSLSAPSSHYSKTVSFKRADLADKDASLHGKVQGYAFLFKALLPNVSLHSSQLSMTVYFFLIQTNAPKELCLVLLLSP
jgi:hypothetical protein